MNHSLTAHWKLIAWSIETMRKKNALELAHPSQNLSDQSHYRIGNGSFLAY